MPPRVVLALALVLLTGVLVWRGRSTGEAAAPTTSAPTTPAAAGIPPEPIDTVVVHVVGAVRRSGVYELEPTARVRDAIAAAGGATPRADLAAVNLAAHVVDGEQVGVPRRGSRAAAVATSATAGGAPAAIVHLNSADLAALDALPGVGPAMAQRIVTWREENGGFRSVDDLLAVPGIGPARLETLRTLVAP